MITITEQEFLTYTGRSLAIELNALDDESRKVDRVLLLWTKRVYREMQKASTRPVPKDEDLTQIQIQAIKDAICEYGEYYIKNGDLYRLSGYDEDKGQLISTSEKEKIQFPTECIDILRVAGLIRRSLSRRSVYRQDVDMWY